MSKKTYFLIALSFLFIHGFLLAQDDSKDTTEFKKLTITKAEMDFVSSYYGQDGNHSAVTGGVGTEKLDFVGANIDVNLYMNKGHNEHEAGLSIGLDYYSSASSDKIDPNTISSASSSDLRVSPTFSWKITNPQKYFSVGAHFSISTEFDYESIGAGFSASKFSKNQNRELTFKWQSYFDQWSLIYPVELRPPGQTRPEENSYAKTPRNSHSASLTFTQVVNKRIQILLTSDFVYQEGLLSTPYQRVYVQGESKAHLENLPNHRAKIPLGIRINYFISDAIIIRTFYRYYTDDWNIKSHTFNVEVPVKISPFLSIYPYYRYNTQTAATYFAPYAEHLSTEEFITSDYDLSNMNTNLAGAGIRWSPINGIARIPSIKTKLKMAELRYGNYSRSDGLKADILSISLSITGF